MVAVKVAAETNDVHNRACERATSGSTKMKFRAPIDEHGEVQPVHLALTSGHTFVIGEAPVEVPQRFYAKALEAGALPEGVDPSLLLAQLSHQKRVAEEEAEAQRQQERLVQHNRVEAVRAERAALGIPVGGWNKAPHRP